MADMEKVIKGIAHHKLGQCDMSGKMCPYWGKSADCVGEMVGDALALLKKQEAQIKTRDKSLEKAREEIKWLRGMLKEQESVKPKIDAFGLPYCPKCKTLVYNTWEFCPHCGQELKWE